MSETPRKFLPFKAEPEADDRAVAAPCYIFAANMVEHGLFARLKVTDVTVLVDAYHGEAEIIRGAVELRERPELFQKTEIIPARLSRNEAMETALAAAGAAAPRGWRRGISRSELFFKESRQEPQALRLYIIRGARVTDAFSGETREASFFSGFLL